MNRHRILVSLFGTCGQSTWREKFIEEYKKRGIDFFNPFKKDWKPEDKIFETFWLRLSLIQLYAITNETLGNQSLRELCRNFPHGALLPDTYFVIMLDENILENVGNETDRAKSIYIRRTLKNSVISELNIATLPKDPFDRKFSFRSICQINSHLKKLKLSGSVLNKFRVRNLYVVDNLDEMLDISLKIHEYELTKHKFLKYVQNKVNKKIFLSNKTDSSVSKFIRITNKIKQLKRKNSHKSKERE